MTSNDDQAEYPAIVFYNSACPVCDAGINSQKDKQISCDIQWLDVHKNPQNLPTNIETIRERLHVKDSNSNLLIGMDAILFIWKSTPSDRWKAIFLGNFLIKPIAGLAYNLFAKILYRWNLKKGHWNRD